MASRKQSEAKKGLVGRVGPLEIDWPRSIGYYGGIGLALALDLIPLPIGLFVAAVPFVKMLGNRELPTPLNFISHVAEGAAKPVGGDGEGTIRLLEPPQPMRRAARDVTGERNGQPGRAKRNQVRRTERNGAGRPASGISRRGRAT
jgi:hypothetical protein